MLPLLLSPIAHCLAQDAGRGIGEGGPAEQQGQRLDRVIIRGEASDTDLRRRASVAKQIYGREEIDKFGDTNVADVLKRLPGVTMQGSAPRMRGLGSDYTIILINGDRAPPGFPLIRSAPSKSSGSKSRKRQPPIKARRPLPAQSILSCAMHRASRSVICG